MRRALFLSMALAGFLAAPAQAQNPRVSSKANDTLRRMFVLNGHFGHPPYASDPFTCDATTKRITYYNTTSNNVFFCNATAWTSMGGLTSPVSGDYVWTGKHTYGSAADAANSVRLGDTAGCVVFEGATADAIETVLCATDPTVGDGTFSLPNKGAGASDTIAVLGLQQTFTAGPIFSTNTPQFTAGTYIGASTGYFIGANGSAGANSLGMWHEPLQTPDAPMFLTGTTSNSVHLGEFADRSTDLNNGPCGTAACINPQFVVHDKDANATNYQSIGLSGLSGSFRVTLTETVATSVIIIPVAAASSVSGELLYTVHAKDATNSQTRSGRVIYSGVAEGVTATCVIGTPEELDNTPTGTLTATVTCTSPANNQIQILLDATSSLVQTTLEAYGTLIHVGSGEPLPQ